MKSLQIYAPALIVGSLALTVRVLYNLIVARGYHPEYDARYYDSIAHNLLSSQCFCLLPHIPTTDRAPLWAFIVTAIYAITEGKNVYARLFFCLLDSGTCALIYLYAKDLFGKRIGFVTGLLAAIYTGLFIYTGWLYTETLYTFLLLAFTYTLYLFQRTGLTRWIIISGVSLALASLTRPNGLFVFGLLIIWVVVLIYTRQASWQAAIRAVLIIILITSCLIAPWTLRNYRVAHVFIPIATGSGVVLAGAYNDTALSDQELLGMWVPGNLIRPPIPQHVHHSYMGEDENRAYALHWVQTHTSSMPYLLGLHFINMWKPYTSEEGLPVREFPARLSSQITWFLMQYMPIPIMLLGALGLVLTWKRWRELLIVYLMILLNIVQCLVFYGSMRFRAPIEPLLLILAGGAIWWLTQNSGIRRYLAREQ
jgi:4-amino-4-deoxy-L-arabinose transferase-like glycosyltransferase